MPDVFSTTAPPQRGPRWIVFLTEKDVKQQKPSQYVTTQVVLDSLGRKGRPWIALRRQSSTLRPFLRTVEM
jgi:hypothetical protein